jgi:hypothetical protein
VSGANDVDEIKIVLASEVVEMGVNKCETRAGTPMSKESRFDIIEG